MAAKDFFYHTFFYSITFMVLSIMASFFFGVTGNDKLGVVFLFVTLIFFVFTVLSSIGLCICGCCQSNASETTNAPTYATDLEQPTEEIEFRELPVYREVDEIPKPPSYVE